MPLPDDLLRVRFWIVLPDLSIKEVAGFSEEWAESFRIHHRIAYNVIEDRVAISTIFVGSGLRFPFETMVIGPRGQEKDGRRYLEYRAAQAGHAKLLEEWQEIVRRSS